MTGPQPEAPQLPPRDQLIRSLTELVAGLAVPVSLPTPLGAAREAWGDVHGQLVGFGWSTADKYEEAIRRIIDGPAPEAERYELDMLDTADLAPLFAEVFGNGKSFILVRGGKVVGLLSPVRS